MFQPISQSIPSLPPASHRGKNPWQRWLILTVAVALGHWAVLVRATLPLPVTTEVNAPVNRPFTTRSIVLTGAPTSPKDTRATQRPAVPPRQRLGTPVPAPHPVARPVERPAPSADHPPPSDSELPDPAPLPSSVAANAAADLGTRLASAPPPETTTEAPNAATKPSPVVRYAIPGSVRLKYDIKSETKGIPIPANGEILWLHDGKTYDFRLEISTLFGSKIQTSKGDITPQGLAPVRFGDKFRSEVAAHFERSKNKVTFSANTPDAPLSEGAQDQISVFVQIASLLAGSPDHYPEGSSMVFQAVGPRSSESWVFKVGRLETIQLPGGSLKGLKLTKDPAGEHDAKAEIWFAPELDYLPARIRLTQNNGDFVDQQWRATQKP